MPVTDPTQRFSSRVGNYVRYRPGYPPDVLELLGSECSLTPQSIIADIGSGTGALSRIFLENGNRVFAVEPNAEMRQAGESLLSNYANVVSVAGTAEATTLPGHSVDFVTAAQAAHWFDVRKARSEFTRIVKPGGWTVLVWNERRTDSTPFLRAYEQLLIQYATDYQEVRHERTTAAIDGFFSPSAFRKAVFEIRQEFDYEALEGRLCSSSYTPEQGQPGYDAMLRELRRIFDENQSQGRVTLDYATRVFYARLT